VAEAAKAVAEDEQVVTGRVIVQRVVVPWSMATVPVGVPDAVLTRAVKVVDPSEP
jgi:hypothetical protein